MHTVQYSTHRTKRCKTMYRMMYRWRWLAVVRCTRTKAEVLLFIFIIGIWKWEGEIGKKNLARSSSPPWVVLLLLILLHTGITRLLLFHIRAYRDVCIMYYHHSIYTQCIYPLSWCRIFQGFLNHEYIPVYYLYLSAMLKRPKSKYSGSARWARLVGYTLIYIYIIYIHHYDIDYFICRFSLIYFSTIFCSQPYVYLFRCNFSSLSFLLLYHCMWVCRAHQSIIVNIGIYLQQLHVFRYTIHYYDYLLSLFVHTGQQ